MNLVELSAMDETAALYQGEDRIDAINCIRNMFKRIMSILVVFLYVSLSAQNVTLDDVTFSKEEIAERDAIARGDGSSLFAKKLLWEMDIDPNKGPIYNIPIPEYSPLPQPVGPSRPMEIHDDSPMSPIKSSGSYDATLKATQKRNRENEIANLQKGNAYTQGNIERMQRNAAERRAREEEENRRDRERGRREYIQRMSGFHAYNAERDRWMATEGLRHLREDVHAMDLAYAPEAKREDKLDLMSGSDMANMLKKKDEGVTVEIVVVKRDTERKNKIGVSLGQPSRGSASSVKASLEQSSQRDSSTVIDIYDDGGYDESSKDLWDYSMSSGDAFITLPTKLRTAKEYEKTLILSKKQLDVEAFFLTTLPGMGCVALFGDSLALLDSGNLDVLGWGKGLDVTEVVACGTRTFAKQREKIIEITLDSTMDVAAFDSENFSIYPETDTTFIVNAFVLDLTIVMRFNIERMTYDEILRIPSPMEKICANGSVVFALNGDKIVDIDPSPVLFYQSKALINDVAMGPDGLLVATDSQVVLFKSKDDIALFCDTGAKRLWSDGVDIYMLDKKGNLYRYSKNNN